MTGHNASTRSWRRRLVALSALALVLTWTSATGVQAQDNQDESSQAEPEDVVLFIVDLSGSMNEPFGDGRTKLEVAKAAFEVAFDELPDVPVGLRVYGDQRASEPPAARQENCETDTRLVEPIGSDNRDALVNQVNGFTAQGDTPIALALQEAANNDIPEGARATIVLFSDGRDECHDADLDGDPNVGPSWGPDPCGVAGDLASAGADVRITRVNTIGFRAGDAAAQLQCIAEDTGGTYTPVETEEDARDAIIESGTPREAERLGGEPIEGTPAADGAPALERIAPGESNRRYTDHVKLNEERWYLAPEYGPGEGHTTATFFDLPKQERITLELRMEPGPDENISSPLVQTAEVDLLSASDSLRCGGCYIADNEAHQMYFVLVVRTEDEDIIREHGEETFYTELLLEETAWGGQASGCFEGNVCWFESQIEAAEQRITELQQQLDGPEDLQPLQEEIAGLESELSSLRSQRDTVEEGPDETTNWLPAILLAVVTVAGAGAWAGVARRRESVPTGSGTATVEAEAVIGTLNLEVADRPAPSSGVASRTDPTDGPGDSELVTEPGGHVTEERGQASGMERARPSGPTRAEDVAGPAPGREVPEEDTAGREVPENEPTQPKEA